MMKLPRRVMKRKVAPSTDAAAPKPKRKEGKPEHARYLQQESSAMALDPASEEYTAAFNAFVRAGHNALGKGLLSKLLKGMSRPLPAAPPAVLNKRAERDASLTGINFEPRAGLGLLRDCEVRLVLVKSWQRFNNAQYMLKEHPELFPSFAAAYRALYGDVEVPPEGDHLWNFSGDLRTPQWCVSATGILQTAAAQYLLGDPTAQYYDLQHINSCVVYHTPQTRSYEVPSDTYLVASYEKLTMDWEVDAQHGRLEYTTYVIESSTQCKVVLQMLGSGRLETKWDFLEDYSTLCAEVEGVPPPPGLEASFARVVVLPEHPDKLFIIVSAYSISTLVKGPWTAAMQRAVALRSYHHSLRVHALLTSLLPFLEGAPAPRLSAYEDSVLRGRFDTTFTDEQLQGVAAPDPADVERLHQICQLGGRAMDALSRELARRIGLDGRPFAWPARAMARGWELAAELATLRWLQSQLERSERQQGERRLLHGGEGGGGEGGGNEDAMPPLVKLSRRASTQHVAERLQKNDAAIKALRESIAAFDAQVRDAGCRADENAAKAKKKRGPEAVPRSKTEMSRESGAMGENAAEAKKKRGPEAVPRSKTEMSRADENAAEAKKKRGPEAEPRSKTEMSCAAALAKRTPEHVAALAKRREHADASQLGLAASMIEFMQRLDALPSGR